MNKFSLKTRLFLIFVMISLICPIVASTIIWSNDKTMKQYEAIALQDLTRTQLMGTVLYKFLYLRIQVRKLAIAGVTHNEMETIFKSIDVSTESFLSDKHKLIENMKSGEDKFLAEKLEGAWQTFSKFGNEIVVLAKKGDEASLQKLRQDILYVCPKLSSVFEEVIEEMIKQQKSKVEVSTARAIESSTSTKQLSLVLTILGIFGSLMTGYFFANTLVKNLMMNMGLLGKSAFEIHNKSNDVAGISNNLSAAASVQAASVQETVASLDEISAMVSRNSDSATTTTTVSENATKAAQKGKVKVEQMMDSIKVISSGNDEIIEQMQRSNGEISQIVTVIQEIATKTQVINDIVFQTKLLSFNASVEAARAGEHGKGFAVVAEEVGNLATMSGKAANEITEMLSGSVKRVTEIVEGTKHLMDGLIKQSKAKVAQGTSTAKECSEALDEILANVSSVNEMTSEIALASKEQATGVREVNMAMSQLDEITQQNSASALASSQAAADLNTQVDRLNTIVSELTKIIQGEGTTSGSEQQSADGFQNVVPFTARTKSTSPAPMKKAVGASFEEAPNSHDNRFEDA